MAAWTHDVVLADVEHALGDLDLTDRSAWVSDVLDRAAAEIESVIRAIGWTTAFPSGSVGYQRAREFLILRTSAEVYRAANNADPQIAATRDRRCRDILAEIRRRPETLRTDWDSNTQLGSWMADQSLEPLAPGSMPPARHWTRGGF